MSKRRPSQNPFVLLLRALWLWLRGRAHLRRNLKGHSIKDHGEDFDAFRKLEVSRVRPGAVFKVRFRFKNLSAAANRRLSAIPIPLIAAQPGFRSKTWFLGRQSGEFIGLYEFDTVEAAEAYWDSLPLRMMRRRAAAGSLSHEIYATTEKTPSPGHRLPAPGV